MEAGRSSTSKSRSPRPSFSTASCAWAEKHDGKPEVDLRLHFDDFEDAFSGWGDNLSDSEKKRPSTPKRKQQTARAKPPVRRGRYKPTPLRWQFLAAEILLLAVAMAVVVALQLSMPGSDNTAFVDGQPMARLRVRGFGRGGAVVEVARRAVVAPRQEVTTFRSPQPPMTTETTSTTTTTTTTTKPPTVDLGGGGLPGGGKPASKSSSKPALDMGGGGLPGGGAKTTSMAAPATTVAADGFHALTVATAEPSATASGPVETWVIVPIGGAKTTLSASTVVVSADVATTTSFRGIQPSSIITTEAPVTTADDDGGFGGGGFHAFSVSLDPDEEDDPTTDDPVTPNTTEPVVRWSTAYVQPDQPTTVVVAGASTSKDTSGFHALAQPTLDPDEDDDPWPPTTAAVVPVPVETTVDVIVSGTPTTMIVSAPAQTTVDAAGSTVVIAPTTSTIVGVVGGVIAQSAVVDDGLTPQTHTIVTTAGGTPSLVVSTPPPQTIVNTVDGVPVTTVTTPPPTTMLTTVGGTPITVLQVTTPGEPVTQTVVSVNGGTVVTVTPAPTTFVTAIPTGGSSILVTLTTTPPPYVTTTGGTTTTFTRTTIPGVVITTAVRTTINGVATTVPTVITITPTRSTRYSTPTAAPTGGGSDKTWTRVVPGFTAAQYWAGTFLPTLVAVCLAVPVAVIDLNAKLFQPFQSLARPEGADGAEAMTLRFSGVHSILTPVAMVAAGQVVPLITSCLLWLSWLLAPLSAEAVGFKVHGSCSHLSIQGCGIALGVSPAPGWALVAVMCLMAALLAALAYVFRSWETGLHSNPWSVSGMASLTLSRKLREPLMATAGEPTEEGLDALFAHGRFHLGTFSGDDGRDPDDGADYHYRDRGNANDYGAGAKEPTYEYGIVPMWDGGVSPTDDEKASAAAHGPYSAGAGQRDSTGSTAGLVVPERGAVLATRHGAPHVPFIALTYLWRGIFMGILLGLAIIILYYHLLHEDNAFELFMDSQRFGVKFLFAALGTVISLFWTSFFMSIATVAPFMRMATKPQSASNSILLTRPTNAFYGVWAACLQRNVIVGCAAAMAVAAEFLPVLLANIPYSLTQTRAVHDGCTGGALAVLSAMIAVLAWSMFVRFPHMPVDPRTVAGAAYYTADSPGLLRDLTGQTISTLDRKARNAQVGRLHRNYYYARVVGAHAQERMAVDAAECHCNQHFEDHGRRY